MLKNVVNKCQYLYHLIQYRHNEVLQQNCLSEELRSKLKVRAIYHNSKVVEIGARI